MLVVLGLSQLLTLGCHSNWVKLISAKKLSDDKEPLILQWLAGGRQLEGPSRGADHLAQFLSACKQLSGVGVFLFLFRCDEGIIHWFIGFRFRAFAGVS